MAQAAVLFSHQEEHYAFGELDEDGKTKLAQFAAQYRSMPDFRPTEGRMYEAELHRVKAELLLVSTPRISQGLSAASGSRWRFRSVKWPSLWDCGPPCPWRGFGPRKAGGRKPTIYWRPFTVGSSKASIRPITRRPTHYSMSWRATMPDRRARRGLSRPVNDANNFLV